MVGMRSSGSFSPFSSFSSGLCLNQQSLRLSHSTVSREAALGAVLWEGWWVLLWAAGWQTCE